MENYGFLWFIMGEYVKKWESQAVKLEDL